MIKNVSPRTVLKYIRFWPPYLAAGISVESVNDEFTDVVVKMSQNKFNTNYVGTHFGGSLYSMCDPFYMFILLHHLKTDHIVWDQAAKIKFLKPGKGTVRARFNIDLETIENLKKQAFETYSIRPCFKTSIIDSQNNVIAEVEKQLYIRRKDAKKKED